jgi:LmbE family N-acetylglucosaminyl deacetylase
MTDIHYEPLHPKIVMGIVAHPDDLDFGASGTMASYAAQGAEIHYLILTDGSKGSEDLTISSEELITIRETEQRAALAILGGTNVEFLHYPDGELEVTTAVKRQVVKAIRTVRPDVVVTMDPSVLYSANRGFINHPDHRAAGQIALDAVFPLARDHLTFPEIYAAGFEPHKTATVLLINFEDSNFTVDISDFMDTKIAALQAHTSQIPADGSAIERIKQWASIAGGKAGVKYAESFVRIDVN